MNVRSADQNLEAVAVAIVGRIRTVPASIVDVAPDPSERQIVVRVIPRTGLEAIPLEPPRCDG
ncbi:MAG: hypothetical protein ACRDYA_16515 [Egibacteraceae bacterium]